MGACMQQIHVQARKGAPQRDQKWHAASVYASHHSATCTKVVQLNRVDVVEVFCEVDGVSANCHGVSLRWAREVMR